MRVSFLATVAMFALASLPTHGAESAKVKHAFPPELTSLAQAINQQWTKYLQPDGNQREDRQHPVIVFGDRLVAVARDGPQDASFLAATFLARMGYGTPETQFHRFMTAGFSEILRRHADNPHLSAELRVDDIGGGGLIELETEQYLRQLLNKTKNPTVRAGAAYALAGLLDGLADQSLVIEETIERFESWPANARSQLEILRDDLEKRDVGELRNEAASLLTDVIRQHPDERPSLRKSVLESRLHSLLRLDLQYVEDSEGPTYDKMAQRLLFAVENLRAGRQAPEIVGVDASGNEFRLSDYRSRVVLLMFSYKGCGACEAMYPIYRTQLDYFKDEPFVILGVMASVVEGETVDTLRDAMDQGKITWRCWWDGFERPIATHWDVQGWPEPYLIDANGIIRRRDPPRDEQKLREAIAALIDDKQ